MYVELDSVGHQYKGGLRLFHDISVKLLPEHVYALIGPSGAGKSTLLSIISGWIKPTAGRVIRSEVDTMRWVFQNPHGVARRTALDHVCLPLLAQGCTRQQAQMEALSLLDRFNLSQVSDNCFSELSGGEAQRLMLARAFAAQPSLMLVDEPTAQLDMHTAATVSDSLTKMAQANCIIVVSTHDCRTRDACTDVIDLKDYL